MVKIKEHTVIDQAIKNAKSLLEDMSREQLLQFTYATMQNFQPAPFHKKYYEYLNEFAHGRIKKLMVFMPPQHGKSEGSTRRLPSFILGRNPDKKIAIVSYAASKARKFNREIQRVIDSPEYKEIFHETRLSGGLGNAQTGYIRTSDECEIVGYDGGFKTVGVGGPLTGDPVDILIMDDLYKDAKTAWSPTIRENVSDWYDTTAETRLHNDSQQLIVFTRWHENDQAGRLIAAQGVYHPETNPNGWVIVIFQAIKKGKPTDYDPREEGEALWPQKHNLEKLELVRKRNNHVFESLYQQDPKPVEGLMYGPFRTYEAIPHTKTKIIKNYTDTADTGSDYLCSISYVETEIGNYVIDVLYTQRPMEYTEVKTAENLTKHKVDTSIIESNNGGRSFQRAVESQCRIMHNNKTSFTWFHQSDNKAVRIFTKSSEVQNLTFFPHGWDIMWPDFYRDLTTYMKEGKNAHDDAPDALTGTIEWRGKGITQDLTGYF